MRVLALRLLEKQKKNPELAKQLGIDIKMYDKIKTDKHTERKASGNENIQ